MKSGNEYVSYQDKNFYEFMESRAEEYKLSTNPRRMILDYISGQTDKFFLKECEEALQGFKID